MIWRKWTFWLALLAAATLVGLLEGVQAYAGASAINRPVTWSRALGSTIPSWYVLVALLPGVLYMARRFPLDTGRWHRTLPVHMAAAVSFALLHVGVTSWLSDYVLFSGSELLFSFRMNLSRLLAIYFMVELVTYFAVVGAYLAYVYARRYREREREAAGLALRASQLEASLSHANLDSLRMQLNPHFLFNTLNAISVMAMKSDRQGVVRMLTLLGDLLRLSLDHRQQVVSLREELEILDRYLEIEYVRFRDRLTLEREIDPDALDAEVPSLLLQPLVENALRHGIAARPGPGTVRVEARIVDGESVEIRVLDTGPGPAGSNGSHGTGVGLANTRARIEQLYGSRGDITLDARPEGGARVTVRLPLRYYTGEPRLELMTEPLRRVSA